MSVQPLTMLINQAAAYLYANVSGKALLKIMLYETK